MEYIHNPDTISALLNFYTSRQKYHTKEDIVKFVKYNNTARQLICASLASGLFESLNLEENLNYFWLHYHFRNFANRTKFLKILEDFQNTIHSLEDWWLNFVENTAWNTITSVLIREKKANVTKLEVFGHMLNTTCISEILPSCFIVQELHKVKIEIHNIAVKFPTNYLKKKKEINLRRGRTILHRKYYRTSPLSRTWSHIS